MSLHPRAGVDYPRSAGAFRSWFGTDADCLDYLDWLRGPHGFVCPLMRQSHSGCLFILGNLTLVEQFTEVRHVARK